MNVLLYAGIAAFIAGLGWTVGTWSQQMGDVLVESVLFLIFSVCFWYCFSRAKPWSPSQVFSPSLIFDYVLYLGSLTWSIELVYFEKQSHLLSGQWDYYLMATALLFFFLAYRFDNRFVLSLAFSSLAGWFGLTISHWPSHQDASYRNYAIFYSLLLVAAGAILQRIKLKPHFFGTYLNIAANVLFWAILSGQWLLPLLALCGVSLFWGLSQQQFSFVAYAAVYGYIGVSWVLLQRMNDSTAVFGYFVVTGTAMLVLLIWIARRFGRQA